MSINRPSHVVPIEAGIRYRRKLRSERNRIAAIRLAAAVLICALAIASDLAVSHMGGAWLTNGARQLAVSVGMLRARSPQPGDSWARCAESRRAGTGVIYEGEPGYRSGLDADGDGVACEPDPHRPNGLRDAFRRARLSTVHR